MNSFKQAVEKVIDLASSQWGILHENATDEKILQEAEDSINVVDAVLQGDSTTLICSCGEIPELEENYPDQDRVEYYFSCVCGHKYYLVKED